MKTYVAEYLDLNGNRHVEVREFTQAQADSVGAVLEASGLTTTAAKALITRWNLECRRYKGEGRYYLPEAS